MLIVLACVAAPGLARAQGDEDNDEGFGQASAPAPVVKPKTHAYGLDECLALADRNNPNLWAARARLAQTHAQLDEVRALPFWQFGAQATGGVIPSVTGTSVFTHSSLSALNPNLGQGVLPFFRADFWGGLPLYTFGKIDASTKAAEAGVRVSEWDLEKVRQLARMDVRRAFFGAMLARDMRYLAKEILENIDKALDGITKKLAKGDTSVDEIDRLRMQIYRDEVVARAQEADKGEAYTMAALRFLTGVQTAFDIPDEPLKRPEGALAPVVTYLAAARLHRPEVNQARAGVVARRELVNLARAKMLPDIGVALGASYATAPSVVIQNNAWIPDNLNHFFFGFAFGARWNLDLVPAHARVAQAEAQLEETRALERYALGGVAVEVESAYANAVEAQRREASWAHAEKKAREWISTVQGRIDLGTMDEKALTEPLRVYVNARIQHNQALMDVNVTLSDLARATGWDAVAPHG